MTPRQKSYYKSLIVRIHLSPRYKELYEDDEDDYRNLLEEHFGVRSSKELNIDQLEILVDYLNLKIDKLPTLNSCTKAQRNKMIKTWNSFAKIKTDAALLEFCNKQTSKQYESLFMITKREAQKIIPVLEKMQKDNICS